MRLAEFIQKNVKTAVDYDKAFGAQCVDLFRQYSKDVLEIPEHTGAVIGAKEIYLNYEKLPKEIKYFLRYDAYTQAEPGIVAVWDCTSTNIYGHVAIVIADLGASLIVFEQKGKENPKAETKAEIYERSKDGLLGYLKVKPKEMW